MKTILDFIGQPIARLGNPTAFLCAAASLVLAASSARASDPVGVYGFVDRVVFEPSEAAPERIQVWGAFALAKKSPGNLEYSDAERGYLYFKLRPGDEAVCKKEWADLKAVAGKREIVAFGSRHEEPQPTRRKLDAKAENPDVHPKGLGVTKLHPELKERQQIKQLLKLMDTPAKESPKGAKAAPAEKKSLLALAAGKAGND